MPSNVRLAQGKKIVFKLVQGKIEKVDEDSK